MASNQLRANKHQRFGLPGIGQAFMGLHAHLTASPSSVKINVAVDELLLIGGCVR